jgi:hypothetical protein
MDNNFYNILQTFKKLNEGVMSEIDFELRDIVAREDFDALYQLFSANTPTGHYVQDLYNEVTFDTGLHPDDDFEKIEQLIWNQLEKKFSEVDETKFAGQAVGQKPGEQWRGTDAGTPGNKLVGGCEESRELSFEEELMNEWQQFMQEAGANNPTMQDPIKAKADAEKIQNASNVFQKLGTQVGIKPGVGANQAAQAVVKNANNPNINPSTGAGMDQTGKKVVGALGKGVEDIVANADPADANKLVNDLAAMKRKAAQG